MKTFLTALLLMGIVAVFACCNSLTILRETDRLLTMAENFPANAAEFEEKKGEIGQAVEDFSLLWDRSMPMLAYTSGYENLNRADEAAILLYAAFVNDCGADFVAARHDFCDALRRLQSLEKISFSSVF